MEENKHGKPKPSIDKEYLKKLAEKIKAEKARKEAMSRKKESEATPPPPPMSSIPPTLLDDDDEDEDMAAEKTAIIDLASLSGQSADARMTIMDGKDEGKSIEITRDEIFAGRSLDNDFVISDISVSRKHFKIKREGDHFLAQDMGSGNGIRVNGVKSPSATLYNNDVIVAGARQIKFEILNEEMKAKYSRKTDISEDEAAPVQQKSSLISWVAIFLVIAGAAVGYYFFTQQSKQIQQAAFKLGFEDIDKVDELIEKFEFKKAEKKVQFLLSQTKKPQDMKLLNERLDLIKKEKVLQDKFNQGKVLFEQKKVVEAGKVLKEIPEDSTFYSEIKKLVGDEAITSWKIDDIKELIATKKEDEALKHIYALLLEQPENADAKALQEQLTSKVGEQKAKDLQKKAAEEKAGKIAAAKERERKKIAAAQKRKARAARRRAARRVAAKRTPQKTVAVAKKSASSGYDGRSIDRARELYLSKDFDSAIDLLDKISGGTSGAVSKQSSLMKLNVIKFKRTWDKAQSSSGSAQQKYMKRLFKYDESISGGKMKGDIASLRSSRRRSPDPFKDSTTSSRKSSKSSGGSMGDPEAKKLYMRARSLRKENPDKAREVLEKILENTSSSSNYNKKAKKLLKKL